MKIKIQHIEDEQECETCGDSYASGANVFFDDELVLTLEPIAHCYGGKSWSENEIFEQVLRKLGHNLEVAYE